MRSCLAPFRRSSRGLSRRTRGKLAVVGVALVLSAAGSPALADPGPVAQGEIDHLLAYVASAPCTFIRNGSEYPAPDARAHLVTKLNYAKSQIATAEDFIRRLATGSSLSGEPYKVRCGKTEVPAGAWLADELKRYRTGTRKS